MIAAAPLESTVVVESDQSLSGAVDGNDVALLVAIDIAGGDRRGGIDAQRRVGDGEQLRSIRTIQGTQYAHAPWFDNQDQFDHQRTRLGDIDGSGTTDIICLHRDGIRLYFNQSGNSWSNPQQINVFPLVDEIVSIVPTDLLGNGTACLVWSSPLTGDAQRPMRYVNLMGQLKPHLLVRMINNLGAETRVDYVPSTKFYLLDKQAVKPWVSRQPFPVHVVERVTTYDHISRNRFVTRYVYHHGYFDSEERAFRGFGMVEQWDTEEFATARASPPGTP